MTARTSETKRRAFLRAFAETGNETLSAERAEMSRSTVRNLRRSDPGFEARWLEAKAVSALRLAGDGNRPPKGWERQGGADLAVCRAGRRPAQVIRSAGRARWTPETEARFLGQLRQCNNVRLACRESGMTLSSYESHWRRWPDFRRRVAQARAFARLRLEALAEAWRDEPREPDRDAIEAVPMPPIADLIRQVRRARRLRDG